LPLALSTTSLSHRAKKTAAGLPRRRRVGGGGGTAVPPLSRRAGLCLHPVAGMRGVLSASGGS